MPRKPTQKKKFESSSPLLTKPDQEGLRFLDVVGATLVGRTVAEDGDGVILEYPGVYTESLRPRADGGFDTVARLAPFGNVRGESRYKVYYSAVRGEVYSYDPARKALYAAFQQWSRAGDLNSQPPEAVIPTGSEDAGHVQPEPTE